MREIAALREGADEAAHFCLGERGCDAGHQRHHGLAIKRAVRFGIVGISIVAGNAQEHRRHAE